MRPIRRQLPKSPLRDFGEANVRFGSKADIAMVQLNVRFTPNSWRASKRHVQEIHPSLQFEKLAAKCWVAAKPGLAKMIFPGAALAAAINSTTLLAGKSGRVTIRKVPLAT